MVRIIRTWDSATILFLVGAVAILALVVFSGAVFLDGPTDPLTD